ncbi:DnrP protein [Colwellia sp. 75C3]|uniref:DnrP protein n=1 Tax=Colwellia sp. 75C3 TaxID=888425 RepID=UPI000C33713D|nr:DnrP protein [Colwellia sp. 75C3]PKG81802.1 DnrP protein [Colwellia sp. 75C3]
MSQTTKTCLYCQSENTCEGENKQCRHCGMELPIKHPNDRNIKVRFFVKAFWLIALFCLVMVFYLPR